MAARSVVLPGLEQLQLYSDRMQQLFGLIPLEALDVDFWLTFHYVYFTCVQPVFYCFRCPFQWAMDVCLATTLHAALDFELLMGPLMSHKQDCSLGMQLVYNPSVGPPTKASTCACAQRLLNLSFIEIDTGSPGILLTTIGSEEHVCSFDLLNWMATLFSIEGFRGFVGAYGIPFGDLYIGP